ncbi:uncharacterized protein [Miscanthus floridulus]|uniref:uncharacterized protein n=1 Tax=Miscanthus floridulus TaxID=154761 RepID=UPI003459290A
MVSVAHSERVTDPKFPFSNSRRKREARNVGQPSTARLTASGRSPPAARCHGPASPYWPRAAADPPRRAGAHLRDDDLLLFHPVLPAPPSSSSPQPATELRAPARDPARRGAPSRGRAPAAPPARVPSRRDPFVYRLASGAAGESRRARAASVPTASGTCNHLPQHEIRPPSPPLAGGAALAAWPCGP